MQGSLIACIRLISIDRDSPVAFSFRAAAFSRRLEEAASASTVSDNSRSSNCSAAFTAPFFLREPVVALRNSGLGWVLERRCEKTGASDVARRANMCSCALSMLARVYGAFFIGTAHDTAVVKNFTFRLVVVQHDSTIFLLVSCCFQ